MSDIFKKTSNIDAETSPSRSGSASKSSGALNLKPIIEDDVPVQTSAAKQDKFPNFIHQGSHLDAAGAHDVHQPSPLILPIAVAAAVIWIICVMALYFGFFGNVGEASGRLSAAQWISVLMLAFIPAVMIGVLAFALRQLSAMSSAATQLARAARTLAQPDDAVIGKAKLMSRAVSQELDTIKKSFDTTVGQVSLMEEVLSSEREKLDGTSEAVKKRFDQIGAKLTDQHKALEGIADIFDQRMTSLSAMLETHKTELQTNTESSEQKLQEARISLETAVSGMNETTEAIRANAIDATASLKVGHREIAELGDTLQDRSSRLVENYKTHSADLAAMMTELREEQDNLATSLDERLAKMRDMSLSAQVGAESLKSASDAGRQTVEALASAANLTDTAIKQRFAEMEDMVRYSNSKAESISDTASRRVQDSLAHTRKEISRIEADMAALHDRLQHPEDYAVAAPNPNVRKPISFTPIETEVSHSEPEPELRPAPVTSPVFSSQPAAEPIKDVSEESALDLVIETPDEALDLQIPDPNSDIQDMANQTIRSADPAARTGRRKARRSSRWGWKDMLTGMNPEEQDTLPRQALDVSDDSIVRALTGLGLSPSAIVDDGCIIEACNARKANGENAMSQVVAKRLGDPVRHLYIKMEADADLKSKARAYTAQYKIGIEAVEDDREAIRMRLESDAGRAFLLCDAALNG